MSINALEIAFFFSYMVTIGQILFNCIFDKIKQKTDVKVNNKEKLIKYIIK